MRTELAVNAAFPPKRRDPVDYYIGLFDRMVREGVGVFRLWFSDFSFNYYRTASREHSVGIEPLRRIVAAARERRLRILPVLFDFNEFSNTDVHWRERDHSFRSSFLASVLRAPMDFFDPGRLELGLSKFRCMQEIIGDLSAGWELFNEVDQVEGFRPGPVATWVRLFSRELEAVGAAPVFLSFANPSYLARDPGFPEGTCLGIHTYAWPFSSDYRNVIYWQSRFPRAWVMEFGTENASPEGLLTAMVASHLLSASGRVAVPWHWDRVLSIGVFPAFRRIEEFLDKRCGQVRGFGFVGSLGRELVRPGCAQAVRVLKLGGIRGAVRKGLALLEAWRYSVKRGPELVFESSRHRVTLRLPGDDRTGVRPGSISNSIRTGGIEVQVDGSP